jgi:hypothetical protein
MKEFVPFEIAKKLKEKGFTLDYNIYGYKPIYADVDTIKFIWNIGAYEKDYFGENIPCPTISEVLEWLRELLEIDIMPNIVIQWSGNLNRIRLYSCSIYSPKLNKPIETEYFDSYDESVLTGIKYVLDNFDKL